MAPSPAKWKKWNNFIKNIIGELPVNLCACAHENFCSHGAAIKSHLGRSKAAIDFGGT
jgi:hypothetical protein